jgi:hypothetical protein
MSIVISYTVLIEYNTGVSRNSQTPQDNVVVLGSSLIFLKADLLFLPKRGLNMNGPAANRTRVSSVQAKYSTTRLRALQSACIYCI